MTITCPDCGWTSSHPEDVEQGYCGHCHAYTSGQSRKSLQDYTEDELIEAWKRGELTVITPHPNPSVSQQLLAALDEEKKPEIPSDQPTFEEKSRKA